MEEHKNPNVQILITELNKVYKEDSEAVKTKKYEVSEATSFLSNIYERVRNTVDYKDEHLIKRFAIQRFLRYSLSSKSQPEDVTDLLIKDLIRGKYISDQNINDSKVAKISTVLSKYIYAKELLNQQRISLDQGRIWDWLLGVASSEIEKVIDPLYKPEIFIKLLSNYILRMIKDSRMDLSYEQESLHVLIACHKALVRSDFSILRYHALTLLYPDFFKQPSKEVIFGIVSNLVSTINYIDGIIKSRTQEVLYLQVRKVSAPFKVLEGVLELNAERVEELLSNPILLRDKAEQYIQYYYMELKRKLNLRITRTLLYLFVTKMILAILIEAPVDLTFYHHLNVFALLVNTIFPVVLFYLIARRIKIPGKENNDRIHAVIKSVVYEDKMFLTEQDERAFKKNLVSYSNGKVWIGLVYMILYLAVYGMIFYVLSYIEFNFTSIAIFIFFVSVLSYFAWNIRARCSDLQAIPQRESLIQSVLNIIALPILKVGQKLSVEVARFNFFTLIFDFIFEAPFKLIIQSFEDVMDFLKSKHEEVVQG